MSKLTAVCAIAFVTACAIVLSLMAPPLLALGPTATPANPTFLTGCSFAKGDAITKVKDFYGIDYDPIKHEQPQIPGISPAAQQALMAMPNPGPAYTYHFAQYGVWVFFDAQLNVKDLRFDSPFRGKIGGIAIGDDLATVRAVHGEATGRSFAGMNYQEVSEEREQHIRDILDALPDPSPKARVIDALAQIAQVEKTPAVFESTNAWIYNAGTPSFVRYDIGSASSKVRITLSDSCTP